MEDDSRLKRVWNQQSVPVLLRREIGKLRVRVPYIQNDALWMGRTQYWLRSGRHTIPNWFPHERFWEVPSSWFNDLVKQMIDKHGSVYVIQPYREQEVCARQCWDAKAHECQCSCMGENHGQGEHGGWLEISDTFATRWGSVEMACRLMQKRPNA
ncbi:hypothetical protein [Sphingomonas faeni]|uniref:hypothetical protein n=1 Tax=Sphingomonas faeni TaxID=185950 RepID=UPI0020C1436A|nr:hypothetical protein [Sphingomonas faeni]MCK8456109.1 hypothetical protein [Sphingomonas faeni]